MTQNISHAVMSQRHEPGNSLDDFPTPPWATRGFIEQVLMQRHSLGSQTCLEPACGRGDMAKVLKRVFLRVHASDIHEYGYGSMRDFLAPGDFEAEADWVITNPPFGHALKFVEKALPCARVGVAMLVRTNFLEGNKRYQQLFRHNPPTLIVQYVERVPMVKGRLDPKVSTATSYCWLVWEIGQPSRSELLWIAPCRKQYERPDDYGAYKVAEVSSVKDLDQGGLRCLSNVNG
jgi:predicted RNA methylase